MKNLALLLLVSMPLEASVFGYVQSASQSGNSALPFGSNNTAGNAILVFTSTASGGASSAVTDTQGNSYTAIIINAQSPAGINVWLAQNIKSGANSVTATGLNSSGAGSSIAIVEVTTPATTKYAVLNCQTENGTTNPFGCNATTDIIAPGEVFTLQACYDFANGHTWTGTNLTIRQTVQEGGGQTLGVGTNEYTSGITAGTVSEILGCSNGGSNRCSYGGVQLVSTPTGSGGASPSSSAFVGLPFMQ